MGEQTLSCKIYIPGAVWREASAILVRVPTATGELGILPNHALLLAQVVPGVLRVVDEEGREDAAWIVRGGFVRVGPMGLEIVVKHVVPLARDAMEEALTHEKDPEARAALERALQGGSLV